MDLSPAQSQIFSALLGDLASRIQEAFTAAAADARGQTRRETVEQVLRAARRIQHSESIDDWAAAVIEAVRSFAVRSALFTVSSGWLFSRVPPIRVRVETAPAFHSAIESRDTVVALPTPGELSGAVAALFQESGKAHLFPIVNRGRVAAVLCAEPETPADAAGLELIAAIAGAAEPKKPAEAEDQALHLRAQRFARALAAEIRLYRSAAVKTGRARADLYAELKDAIEAGREAYRRRFENAFPVLADYFHAELIHTLANDDAALLGQDYPGPLV